MKFGFSLYNVLTYPSELARVARAAEEAGFESLFTPDHLVFPMEMPATYPYARDGRPPPATSGAHPRYDPWALLSHLAAATSRIRLGTNVYILPLRDPIATARATATLDVLSNGRALIGVGVGWLKEEFEIIGRDFGTRGAVTDEAIQLLKQLWTQKVVEYRGKHLAYGPFMFEPKPVQKPHPPVLVGGTTPPALRRAARYGDGWMSTGDDYETTKGKLAELRRLLKEQGRERAPFEVTCSLSQADRDAVRRYEDLGATRLLVPPVSIRDKVTPDQFIDGLKRVADSVIDR